MQYIYNGIADGMPTLAEGGGLMYISESITDPDGQQHEMVGIVPGRAQMESKLVALGYRSVTGKENNFLLHTGKTVRGHVFHYSSFSPSEQLPPAYETSGRRGVQQEGVVKH